MFRLVFTLASVFTCAKAGYGRSSSVKVLTSKNFKKEVLDAKGVALVAFYAPWCGHCKRLEPEWKSAAKMLEGVVTIGAVDATEKGNEPLAATYGVKGFPTIKIFGSNKAAPTPFNGERKADAIVGGAMQEVINLVRARGGGGSDGSGAGGNGNSDVIELQESSFDKNVLNSEELWLVKFIAPWCGHCKKLQPEFSEAATLLKGEAKLGSVDATAETNLASRFGVKGYPTIKLFPPKTVRDGDAVDYNGPRESDGIVSEVQRLLEEHAGPVEVVQLISQAVLDAKCPPKKICVISSLPDIRDSSKKERERYLKMLVDVATKKRRSPFRFLWTEGGAHAELEAVLGLNFGFPAAAAVSRAKNVIAVHRGAFDAKKLSIFLTGIASGGTKTRRLEKALPAIKAVEPWNGEDAAVEEEEEFSLDDIMGEEL